MGSHAPKDVSGRQGLQLKEKPLTRRESFPIDFIRTSTWRIQSPYKPKKEKIKYS